MPHALAPPQDSHEPAPVRKRWSRKECEFLVQSDVLLERYELIDGEIYLKMGQKPSHAFVIRALMAWLVRLFGEERVQVQLPVEPAFEERAGNEPEPDVAVTARPYTEFAGNHPGAADLLLVIEVSDTTLRFDLREKAFLYARAGIADYWAVDVSGRRAIVHRQPGPDGYGEIEAYGEDESVSPLADPNAVVRIGDLLPPPALQP